MEGGEGHKILDLGLAGARLKSRASPHFLPTPPLYGRIINVHICCTHLLNEEMFITLTEELVQRRKSVVGNVREKSIWKTTVVYHK
jgi:hypothetical protein